jgi:hypothetical protein
VDDVERSDGLKGPSWHASLKILAINREDVTRIEKHLLVEKLQKAHAEKPSPPVRRK